MSTRQLIVGLYVVVSMGVMAVGCGVPLEEEPLVAYADSLFALDLYSGHQTSLKSWDEDDLAAIEPVFIDGCTLSVEGLPENAWLEGLTLIWFPDGTQLGDHELTIRYGDGCDGHLREVGGERVTITVVEPWGPGESLKYEHIDSVHDLE